MRKLLVVLAGICISIATIDCRPANAGDMVGLLFPYFEWEGLTLYYSQIAPADAEHPNGNCEALYDCYYWHPTANLIPCPWEDCTSDFEGLRYCLDGDTCCRKSEFNKGLPELPSDESYEEAFDPREFFPPLKKRKNGQIWHPHRGISGQTGLRAVGDPRKIQLSGNADPDKILTIRLYRVSMSIKRSKLASLPPDRQQSIAQPKYIAFEVNSLVQPQGDVINCESVQFNGVASDYQATFTYREGETAHKCLVLTHNPLK